MIKEKQNRTVLIYPHAQQGGALLVALILIFMLSIMGISSMRGSTLEKRMATNSIQTATTFQGAESANEMAINNSGNLTSAINVADIKEVNKGNINPHAKISLTADLLQEIGMSNDASVQYVGDGPAYGFSWGNDSSSFVAYQFVIVSEANVDSIRAKKAITQGAYRIAPAR